MPGRVTSPRAAWEALRDAFPADVLSYQECFVCAALDARHALLGAPWLVAVGTATGVTVHPRDIFREAIRRNAVGVVMAHNHPSGYPDPSKEDHDLTERIKQSGEVVGVPLLDHIVCVSDGFYSIIFKERG